MKGFFRKKLILIVVAFVMIVAAISVPLVSSVTRSHAAGPDVEKHTSIHDAALHMLKFNSVVGGGFSFSKQTDTACSPGPADNITPPLNPGDHVVGSVGLTTADPTEEAPEGETLFISDTAHSFSKVIGFISGTAPFEFTVPKSGDVLTACIQGGSGDETGTVSGTVTPPLFVLLQGINTSLDTNGKISDFYATKNNVPGIVPFLVSNGYTDAQFLSYSYKGSNPSNGNPLGYSCLDTFTQHISNDASLLGQQIANAVKAMPTSANPNIYIMGHSLGGQVAYAYLTALLRDPTIVPPFPSNASLKGVVTLDSPVGGVSSSSDFEHAIFDHVYKEMKNKKGQVVGGCKGLTKFDQMVSVFDLAKLFDTTSKSTFPGPDDGKPNDNQGAHASDLKLLGGKALTNQELAEIAAKQSTPVLTVGNTHDFVYHPGACHLFFAPGGDFLTSQWIEDEAGTDDPGDISGVYARQFKAGTAVCEAAAFYLANHFEVYNNTEVENGLLQFFPLGGVPSALTAAPSNP